MGQLRPVAGWYDCPLQAGRRRYWDGDAWTEDTHPKAPASPSPVSATPDVADRRSAENGKVLAILLPLVGLIVGIAMLNKQPDEAWKVIWMSLVAALVYYLLFAFIAGG